MLLNIVTNNITNERNKNKNNLMESAIYYAKHFNWSVFPLAPNSKNPITSDGFKSATTDIEQIKKWWSKTPNANIGIATGNMSNFFVVDLDGETGINSFEDLLTEYNDFPETVECLTGKEGGKHIYLKFENGNVIKNKTDWLGKGSKVDIRGNGGYIVAPPSIHPNGNLYEWELSSRPNEIPIAKAPQWLLNKLVETKNQEGKAYKRKSSSYWEALLGGIKEGGRNDGATRLAGHFFRKYLEPGEVYEIMTMWNERNDPPLEIRELETIMASVYRIELNRRKEREVAH